MDMSTYQYGHVHFTKGIGVRYRSDQDTGPSGPSNQNTQLIQQPIRRSHPAGGNPTGCTRARVLDTLGYKRARAPERS